MPRLTLFKDRLNLVKELKSTADGGRLFQTGAKHCAKKFLTVIVSAMFLHYFVSLTSLENVATQ